MSSLFAPHWRCVPPDAIVWREWDGEVVVRNERSGSSHLLGPLAGRVLQILLEADGALSVGAIAARLDDQQAIGANSDWCAAIDEVLAEFHRLELARPARP
jgi:PqqD family protein of HPr-rel-A system